MVAMSNLQRILHRGELVAVVICGQAIIPTRIPEADLLHIQAKCLYALELADEGRADDYTDADAETYARVALGHR